MRFTPGRKKITSIWLWLLLVIAFLVALSQFTPHTSRISSWTFERPLQKETPSDVVLVVASQREDNTTWLQSAFPDWEKVVFVTDDENAANSVPANRGREAMVYLTFIIEHYDNLPRVAIFHHASEYQWHNDDPLFDGRRVLSRLQIPYVEQKGYVNLRCAWTLGCPAEIRPFDESDLNAVPTSPDARAGWFYKAAFEELFPEIPMPQVVGVSCCAQFAVTAERIRKRPRADYERYRRWLLETPLADSLSGRILEYSWHIMFGEEAVYCPNASDCYCNLFGLCNIHCEDEGNCRSQYTLPKYSQLPSGWPDIDWDGTWRNITELRTEQELDFAPRPSLASRQIR
ncbi:Hypothetical protein R9X50_00614400 [Acrodontium crateriforme]|uniref:Uncharacterized protein n=1 Tax=Acrodontium crateriforme TaxID=150365 RepID=A0AAQ3M7F6_9PEZI|nr:Hypothetical protein R9X50_00614400 [Acrodontium crateriforme]